MTPPATAAPIPASRPRRAQRASGGAIAAPALPRRGTRPAPPRARAQGRPEPLLERLIRASDHRLLDRLIRGRLWIGVLAFALIGIVAMQLAILSLNRNIGRSLQRVSRLQRENPALSISNSMAAAGENVEPQAAAKGMQMASTGAIQFLAQSPGVLARAAHLLASAPVAPTQTPTPITPSASVQQQAQQSSGTPSEGAGAAPPSGQVSSSQPPASPASEGGGEHPAPAASETAQAASPPSEGQTGAQSTAPASTGGEGSSSPAQAPATVGAGGGTQAGT